MVKKELELKPAEEEKAPDEQKKPEFLIQLNKKEGDFLINEFYQLISIYYSANQLSSNDIPKDPNYYITEIIKKFKEFHIIE